MSSTSFAKSNSEIFIGSNLYFELNFLLNNIISDAKFLSMISFKMGTLDNKIKQVTPYQKFT